MDIFSPLQSKMADRPNLVGELRRLRLLRSLPESGGITATDLDLPMLDRARLNVYPLSASNTRRRSFYATVAAA